MKLLTKICSVIALGTLLTNVASATIVDSYQIDSAHPKHDTVYSVFSTTYELHYVATENTQVETTLNIFNKPSGSNIYRYGGSHNPEIYVTNIKPSSEFCTNSDQNLCVAYEITAGGDTKGRCDFYISY